MHCASFAAQFHVPKIEIVMRDRQARGSERQGPT
jgi:hypothetical protein